MLNDNLDRHRVTVLVLMDRSAAVDTVEWIKTWQLKISFRRSSLLMHLLSSTVELHWPHQTDTQGHHGDHYKWPEWYNRDPDHGWEFDECPRPSQSMERSHGELDPAERVSALLPTSPHRSRNHHIDRFLHWPKHSEYDFLSTSMTFHGSLKKKTKQNTETVS